VAVLVDAERVLYAVVSVVVVEEELAEVVSAVTAMQEVEVGWSERK
jgi:hypothetical protein